MLDQDYAGRAVAHLADRLRKNPESWQAATYAMSILEQRAFAMPTGLEVELPEGLPRALPVISSDGALLAVADRDQKVRVYDAGNGRELFPPLVHDSELVRLAFLENASVLASAAGDGSVYFWDAGSGKLQHNLKTHAKPLRGMAVSADGKTLAVAGDNIVEVWRVSDALAGRPPLRMLPHSFQVGGILLSRDGNRTLS